MTKKARRDVADSITKHCEALWALLQPFIPNERLGFGWHFQPNLDLLALELSLEYTKGRDDATEEELEDIQHSARFAMYYLLMERLEDVLATIVQSAEGFAECETILKKPNDGNARRLLFLRRCTDSLYRRYGSPCRGVTLALASAFFDCADLDEASISKLAPVKKPEPVEVPKETIQRLMAQTETMLAKAVEEGDEENIAEWTDNLNFYRELLAKSSG